MRFAPLASMLAVLLLGFGWTQPGNAQMRIAASPSVGSPSHMRGARGFLVGSPFWWDSYPAPYSTPSVIVVQTPASPPERVPKIEEEPKSAAPLMIEWQGDRYVRRSETSPIASRAAQPDYIADAKTQSVRARSDGVTPRTELPSTVFIFRDGHHEESNDYSIISGVIYARGDYWTTGSWSKQIKLSQLDLSSTFRANQERGVTFRLPAGPNEVITRP
jgi:hypothetical protein